MASLYQQRVDKLVGWGLLPIEARELAKHYRINKSGERYLIGYTIEEMRSTPYLNNFVKARRLYVINQRNKLIPEKVIRDRIKLQYINKGFVKPNGEIDVWAMLRDIRKKAIDSGEYNPIKRKGGTHHPVGSGISKGALDAQWRKKSHHKSKSFGKRYEEAHGR